MLTYSNHLKRLVLPEYGRNIQNMVDHCVTIEDREERNRCANTIIAAMKTLCPPTGDPEECRRKLWDHLWIMSNFALDVDYPYEHVDPSVFTNNPEPVRHERPGARPYSIYGSLIPDLIGKAIEMDESPERDALVSMIANHMKKTLLAVSPDMADDRRVLADLRAMSRGAIALDPESFVLQDYKYAPTPSGKKKKKR